MQKALTISNKDDINSVSNRMATIGADLLVRVMSKIRVSNKRIKGARQDDSAASYAPKRYPKDGEINWTKSSSEILNMIRALKPPYPNAFTFNSKHKKIEISDAFIPSTDSQVSGKTKGYRALATKDGIIMVKFKTRAKVKTS